MSKVSASVIKAAGGVKPNSDVMRTRAILGRWRGSLPAAKVSVTFGSDGSAVIEALREDGALVAGGTGRYAWKPDGTLAGTFTGASGAISGFSSWTASFPDAATVALSGADASAKLTRSGF